MTTLTPEKARKVDVKGKRNGKKFYNEGVSISQLRKIYGEIKQAESKFRLDNDHEQAKQTLLLLKPHLAYAAARHDEMETVHEELSKYIDSAVKNDDQMELFFRLMEATVAYHAYYDKKGGDN